MVEGKLRKLSQIAQDLLDLLPFSQSDDQYYDSDDFTYVATPTSQWATEGDTWDFAQPEGWALLTTPAVDGQRASLAKNTDSVPVFANQNWELEWRGNIQSSADAYYFIGAVEALPTEANPPVEPDNGVYFRIKNEAAYANIFAVVRKATVETAVDTGEVADIDPHKFKITNDQANFKFYIDDVLVATIPNTGLGLGIFPAYVVVAQAAAAKVANVDYYRTKGTRFS